VENPENESSQQVVQPKIRGKSKVSNSKLDIDVNAVRAQLYR
jgi:hypothetical protein